MPPKKKAAPILRWLAAAKANGYLVKGAGFKKLPKKGTEGYNKIKQTYDRSKPATKKS